VVALTGAGVSTDSGIPDYRGPAGALRHGHTPMTYQEFVGDPDARRRHWARGHVGWRRVAGARPNPAHRAVADLQREGWISGLITQNVDGLHRAAGSHHAVELHGDLGGTVCLDCGVTEPRSRLAERLDALNPGIDGPSPHAAPDGDAHLADETVERFVVADCVACGGVLKPDVVFFGEQVPRDRVDRSMAMVDAASALLVLGSSLAVMSGYRFVIRARRNDTPVAIVNRGETRGDGDATLRIDAGVSEILPLLVEQLPARRHDGRRAERARG
ncbi:MAG: NAD-dependent protein deacetylase, partial [Miltoncostaeaceae bacterium]